MKILSPITENEDVASKQYTDTGLNGKQNTLVSGTNIKTINNESILGSGNLGVYGEALPIGSEIDYDGLTVPTGWEQISDSLSDVQVNSTSIVSNGVANLVTNTAYNASSNKIATMTDIANAITTALNTPV